MEEKNTSHTLFGLPIFKRVSISAFIWTGLSIVALLLLFVFFASPTFKGLLSQNQFTLTVPLAGSHVFLDTDQVEVTTEDNETVVLRGISDGTHVVMVAKNDYWTWANVYDFTLRDEYSAHSFLIPRDIKIEQLAPASEEYKNTRPLFNTAKEIPREDSPVISPDGKTQTWIVEGLAFIEWLDSAPLTGAWCATGRCQNPLAVSRTTPARNVAFLPHRNDVLLIESENTIVAIGAEGQSHQTLFEAPRGTTPSMRITDDQEIFVLSEGDLYRIDL